MMNNNPNYINSKIVYEMYKDTKSNVTVFDIYTTHYHSEDK